MKRMTMSYKGIVWQVNPTALHVECQRNLKETVLPFAGSGITDLGVKKRRVSGTGYFIGPGCMERWRELEAAFRQGGAGSLILPGLEPFWAVLDGLKLLGEEGGDLIKYSFTFTEAPSGERRRQVFSAAAGESLWDYAGRYGWDMEELRAANPHIRDIAQLELGEEVYAP